MRGQPLVLVVLLLLGACSSGGAWSSSSTLPTATDSTSSLSAVRFVEGSPLLEADVSGTPIGLGASYLTVDGTTIASSFGYGTITQYIPYAPGAHSIEVFDSVGYFVGPFKTPALASGKSYSIALVGRFPKYSLLTFEESSGGNGAALRVYEASPKRPSVDFGSFKASTASNYRKLAGVPLGRLAEVSLGSKVSDFGAYVGRGTKPITGGSITLQSVDSFDARNTLPFHNATRLSLFVLDASPGAQIGPVFGILDGRAHGIPPSLTAAVPLIPVVGNTPSPPPKHLYVDHNGIFFAYALPLAQDSKPLRKIVEAPGAAFPPQIAVDPFGRVAIITPAQIRLFYPPITSFAPSAARLAIALSPAITQIGPSGADVIDAQFDPSDNLWLFSGLGGEISELAAPLRRSSVAGVVIPFGSPGTKAASYGLIQGRFDVSSNLYIYAASATNAQLFKTGFPYAKPPAPTGLNVEQADFVDSSQYLPTDPVPASLILGQYFGPLASPPPQKPPPLPVNVLAQ
ncbi:MAG: DUF4397 domain-containing protein, partial [Candidatus Eremiobacteraeota bacterium]|nr:DUF4397 domain-containing protein [Candidatus Eremiobacteraeota bacterium]